jgi:hypothetical protein
VGINYAIMDAVVAANVLHRPLLAGSVSVADLATVQRKRQWPVRIIQAMRSFVQKRILTAVLQSQKPIAIPGLVRFLFSIRWISRIPAYLLGFGICPARVED